MVWISKESAVSSVSDLCKSEMVPSKPKWYARFKNASIWPCFSLLVKLHQADIAYATRITIID